MKTLFKIPYYLFIAAVGSIGLLLMFSLMPFGGVKVKIVKSGSMEPTIKTGGIVVIRPTASYGVGDIITFGTDTKTQIPTTHRILKIENGNLTTKGDANDAADPSQTRVSEVRGKVLFTIPYLGYVLDFAKKPLGFLLLVGVPALIVIIDEINKILREVRKMRSNASNKKSKILDLRVVGKQRQTGQVNQTHPSFSIKSVIIVLGLGIGLAGLSSVHSTVSYYNDKTTSVANLLQASTDYGIPVPTFAPEVASLVDLATTTPEVEVVIEAEPEPEPEAPAEAVVENVVENVE